MLSLSRILICCHHCCRVLLSCVVMCCCHVLSSYVVAMCCHCHVLFSCVVVMCCRQLVMCRFHMSLSSCVVMCRCHALLSCVVVTLQVIIQSGLSPTILQQLCALPFQYFSDVRLTAVLFPTLVSCCFLLQRNREILEQELSCALLANFVEVGIYICLSFSLLLLRNSIHS